MPSTLTAHEEAVLRRAVGAQTYQRGRDYAAHGAVSNINWNRDAGLAYGQVFGTAPYPYTATASLTRAPDGSARGFHGVCTCPVRVNCKHSVAVLLVAGAGPADATVATVATVAAEAAPDDGSSSWERSLQRLAGRPATANRPADRPGVALQFDLGGTDGTGGPTGPRAGEVVLRPVLAGRSGGWVRSGISWSRLDVLRYSAGRSGEAHRRLLAEILLLHDAAGGSGGARYRGYYGTREPRVGLDTFASRRIWDLLAEARESGLPLVWSGRDAEPVRLAGEPVEVGLDVRGSGDGLAVAPTVCSAGVPIDLGEARWLGDPPHGLAWWPAGGGDGHPRLAPLSAPAGVDARVLLAAAPVAVPAGDRDRFLHEFYPRLRQTIRVASSDGSVTLPEIGAPRLVLEADHDTGHRARLSWHWDHPVGERHYREPLVAGPALDGAASGGRESAAERELLGRVADILGVLPGLVGPGAVGARPLPSGELDGMDTVTFCTEVLPRLAGLDGLDVVVSGEPPDYREADTPPVVAFGAADNDGADGAADGHDESGAAGRDWFDLAVTVSVDGEPVPFGRLFGALAAGEPFLILDSGTYFALDRPEFAQLAALIAESRELYDAEPGTVRVGRFQVSMWDELERLGVVDAQAAAWAAATRALRDCAGVPAVAPPRDLAATLRPYQHSGFEWLAFLREHGLGGVLADEMGLGKTVQTIALFCHVAAGAGGGSDAVPPFLVVAPTSVVHNWATECGRFAPHLRVRVVTETLRRRGVPLAEVAAGADVVITSYTLFRLEYDDYAAVSWSGLVLDEAQAVKNHNSAGYRCAKQLPAPFKLAITGTPMENNLMELWALLSITAPGLFPHPGRFEQFYRVPIERGRDAERLARLRACTRPLLLRRTKQQVVTDLPAKQEQVVELELNARHRKVYQTHLQRERQKVLGLLGDLDGNRFAIFRSLTLLRQASLDAALVDPSHATVPSTKLDLLMDQLDEIIAGGHRVVVFSQFTRFLGRARDRLRAAGIEHCYLDGSTRRRSEVLDRFKNGSTPVFLISLKAGGVGLNLTEADYCIILDPWWNPAVEAQAVDRIHRIGQSRPVIVYRLVAADTIEEKVMALKAEKAALFDSVVDGGAAASGALTPADIRALVA